MVVQKVRPTVALRVELKVHQKAAQLARQKVFQMVLRSDNCWAEVMVERKAFLKVVHLEDLKEQT